jgi:hypothetical protein
MAGSVPAIFVLEEKDKTWPSLPTISLKT